MITSVESLESMLRWLTRNGVPPRKNTPHITFETKVCFLGWGIGRYVAKEMGATGARGVWGNGENPPPFDVTSYQVCANAAPLPMIAPWVVEELLEQAKDES